MSRPPTRQLRWTIAGALYAAGFLAFLYVPVGSLLVLSVNDSPVTGFPLRGFTTAWYVEALADGGLIAALLNSLLLGAASAVVGTALALAAVLGLRRGVRFASAVLPVVVLPIVMPGIVTGVVMLVFFGLTGIRLGLWPTTFLVHVTWVLPFAFLTLYPRLAAFDHALEEAAMDLGATPAMVFRKVVFPIIRPGVIGAALFAFTLSFDEFIRSYFVIGTQRTVPVHLWILINEQVAPFLPAVGAIIMALTLSIATLGFVASARAGTPRAPRQQP
jgi:spermidine/putrescine transport system permease protein